MSKGLIAGIVIAIAAAAGLIYLMTRAEGKEQTTVRGSFTYGSTTVVSRYSISMNNDEIGSGVGRTYSITVKNLGTLSVMAEADDMMRPLVGFASVSIDALDGKTITLDVPMEPAEERI